jgi:hypothetical protein
MSSPEPEEALKQWRQLMAGLPEQLRHPYRSSAPNAPVPLYDGPLHLRRDTGDVEGEGELEYRWLPSPHVHVQGFMDASAALDLSPAEHTLAAPAINLEARCLIGSVSLGLGTGQHEIDGRLQGGPWVGDPEPMNEVLFLLPNFDSYLGSSIRTSDDGMTKGRLRLEADGWLVEVDKQPEARDLKKKLRSGGGYGVRHVGRLQRSDRETFSRDEAEDMLGLLHFLFSFARGFRCGPALSVGRRNGERVCEQWTQPNISPWTGLRSWFPTVKLEDLDDIFHGFLDRWDDSERRRPLHVAIHWYCAANENEGALEGALILAQTALELLTWAYFEEGGNPEVLQEVDDEPAFRSFARLLGELEIPTEIPESPPELRELARMIRDDWDAPVGSGPELITRVRNWVVHPHRRHRRQLRPLTSRARYAVRELALWYIELILFRLLSYNGHYMNRLGQPEVRMGSDQLVPWANK